MNRCRPSGPFRWLCLLVIVCSLAIGGGTMLSFVAGAELAEAICCDDCPSDGSDRDCPDQCPACHAHHGITASLPATARGEVVSPPSEQPRAFPRPSASGHPYPPYRSVIFRPPRCIRGSV